MSDLSVHPSSARGIGKLVEMGILSGVPILSFDDASLGASGGAALAGLPADAAVRRLSLYATNLEPSGARHLLRGAFVPRLESLDLGNNGLWPMTVRELAGRPLDSLRTLGLAGNQLREGPGLLARAPWISGLRRLDISACLVNPAGLLGLLGCDLSGLESLNIARNDLGDAELAALARSPVMGQLKQLNLNGLRITARGLHAFEGSPRMPSLRRLDVGIRTNGDEIAAQIARSSWAATLEMLVMRTARMTDVGAMALAESEYLGRLGGLYVDVNEIPPAAAARLRERFGTGVVH